MLPLDIFQPFLGDYRQGLSDHPFIMMGRRVIVGVMFAALPIGDFVERHPYQKYILSKALFPIYLVGLP